MQIVYGLLWFASGIVFLASLAFLFLGGGCVILASFAGLPRGDDFGMIFSFGFLTIAVLVGSFNACKVLWRRLSEEGEKSGPAWPRDNG